MATVVERLEQFSTDAPERRLFAFLDDRGTVRESYSYGSFAARTDAVAAELQRRHDLAVGDRALLVYPPGLELVVAFVACVKLGVLPVPVPAPTSVGSRAGTERIRTVTADSKPRLALTTRQLQERFDAAIDCADWAATDVPMAARRPVATEGDPRLFIQYTSGSTRQPRGVVVTHANVLANATSTLDHVATGVCWLPQHHDMGLIGYYLFALVSGGTTYGMSPSTFLRRPELWFRTISDVKATYTSSPNFGFEYCLRPGKLDHIKLAGVDLSSLRVLMNASEPVNPDTQRRFRSAFAPYGLRRDSCVVAYGLAENTLAVSHYGRRAVTVRRELLGSQTALAGDSADSARPTRMMSCGAPLAGIDVRIVEPSTRRPVPGGRVGEIWVAGAGVCAGYWNRPEESAARFHNTLDGDDDTRYLATGDLGFMDGGELFVCGRACDVIVQRGVNVFATDVEAAVVAASDGVRPEGVVAFRGRGDELVVVVELVDRYDLPDLARIVADVRQDGLEVTELIAVPPRLAPRTTSGKLQRVALRERYLADDLPALGRHRVESDRSSDGTTCRDQLLELAGEDRLDADLVALGVESLLLIETLLHLEDGLDRCGARDLADELDVNVLQRLTVREVVDLLDRLDTAGGVRPGDLEQSIRAMRRHVDDATRVAMVADAAVDLQTISSDRVVISAEPDLGTSVLITGATGSFGPYLLQQLLQRTAHRFTVLVRAAGDEAAGERLSSAISATGLMDRRLRSQMRERVTAIAGDVAQPRLGLSQRRWSSLADSVDGIVHNAAAVNYLSDYAALRACNVEGTRRLLRLAAEGRATRFDYISTTFVFGWSRQPMLLESDTNAEMRHLTFGYAQSKWVAEQLVRRAAARGLDVRIFRPALISPLTARDVDMADVAVRVLAFMIKYGVAPTTTNQLSVLPADVAAANIAGLIGLAEPGGRTYHVTADDYYNIVDLTASMSRQFGFAFEYHPVPAFVALMNELCDRSDPLFPLLSFFTRSSGDIAAMEFKRYASESYRSARERVESGPAEPRLDAVAAHLAARVMEGGWATMSAAVRS